MSRRLCGFYTVLIRNIQRHCSVRLPLGSLSHPEKSGIIFP